MHNGNEWNSSKNFSFIKLFISILILNENEMWKSEVFTFLQLAGKWDDIQSLKWRLSHFINSINFFSSNSRNISFYEKRRQFSVVAEENRFCWLKKKVLNWKLRKTKANFFYSSVYNNEWYLSNVLTFFK